LSPRGFSGKELAKLAGLSSKSCVPVQQVLLV
jgi:hypothetical protein